MQPLEYLTNQPTSYNLLNSRFGSQYLWTRSPFHSKIGPHYVGNCIFQSSQQGKIKYG